MRSGNHKIMKIISKWASFDEYVGTLSKNFNKYSLFHQPIWLNAVKKGFNVDIKSILTFSDQDNLVALTPIMVKKKGPFCLMGSPLRGMYTEHAGILFKDCSEKELQSKILKSQLNLLKNNADYIEFGFNVNFDDLREQFIFMNFKEIISKSSEIDISLEKDQLWDSYSSRARNMIRKSEKNNVSIAITAPDRNWINNYYQMLSDTFSRQGKKCPHPKNFFLELIELHDSKKALFLTAKLDSEMISAAIFLINQNKMIYLSGTANKKGMSLAATSAIQWHAMQYGHKNGHVIFDMGGLGIPSIDKFKLSFGGEVYNKSRWVYQNRLFSIVEPMARWAIDRGFIRF